MINIGKKGAGLLAYLFWIIVGALIGGFLSLRFFCE